jgi:hypothetical protein
VLTPPGLVGVEQRDQGAAGGRGCLRQGVDGADGEERVAIRRRGGEGAQIPRRGRRPDRRRQVVGRAQRADDRPLGGECVQTARDGRVLRSLGDRGLSVPTFAVVLPSR